MSAELSQALHVIESAAKRYSRFAAVLVAAGLLLFFASAYYAASQLTQMDRALAEKRVALQRLQQDVLSAQTELQAAIAQRDAVRKERDDLEAFKATSEASAEENKLNQAEQPPAPADIEMARVPVSSIEEGQIDALVANLYSASASERTHAYNQLTGTYRAKDYTADRLLTRLDEELAKPVAERNSVGIYNTLVALTDMSRLVTQKPEFRNRIEQTADEVAAEDPKLQKRVEILKKWLATQRR